jgi:hypothetical protein
MYKVYFFHPMTGELRTSYSTNVSLSLNMAGFEIIYETEYLRIRLAIEYAMNAIGATPRTSGPMSMRLK